jgi:transposase-like protein
MNLIDLAQKFNTEAEVRGFLERKRWPNGAVCPHCGVEGESYRLTPKAGSKRPVRPGVWKCGGCRKQFTVRVGTIFEDSHIPLHKWTLGIHLMVFSKKGMSAHQIHRLLGIGYQAAWFMCHRIRYAMTQEPLSSKLSGTVEIDETYVGGKLRVGPLAVKPGERPQDRRAGVANKAPVVSLVERNGKVRSMHVANVTAANLKQVIREHVEPTAHVMTDEAGVYDFVGKEFARHSTVNHREKEYSRREADGTHVTTNTVEGYFSLLKRGVYGTFHHISK